MDIILRQGETLVLTIEIDDETADTARLLVSDEDDNVVIDEVGSFQDVDGDWRVEIISNDTNHPVGDYSYMIEVEFSDGTKRFYPEAVEDCEDDECDLPTLTICES